MNVVILIGRLTRDPEVSVASSGTTICRFSLAVDRKFKRDGQPTADFFNCVAFGKTAETIGTYVTKGRQIGVQGSAQVRNYEGKDGVKRTATDIVVNQFDFIGSRNDNTSYTKPETRPIEIDDDFSLIAEGDDLPF